MKSVKIVSVSKNKKHLIKNNDFTTSVSDIDNEIGISTKIINLSDNKDGLPKVFNRFLNESKNDNTDILMLLHADVMFDYNTVMKHYLKVSEKYDIVGFAGTKKIDLSISPLTWFTGSRNFERERFGRITHKQFNLGESFFNGFSHPEIKDTEVSTIDGLCMILNKKVINSDVQFDERFNFDFYDLDFCLTSIIQKHLKIGVMIEPVIHESVGTSILRSEYLIEERKFREKWQLK